MDSKRKLLIVIMNRIVQPEIFCEDHQWTVNCLLGTLRETFELYDFDMMHILPDFQQQKFSFSQEVCKVLLR